MRDFIRIHIETSLDQQVVFEHLRAGLPDFKFRMGDSDSQGLYVSGRDQAGGQIKIWLGEAPADMTVSLRQWHLSALDRESRKSAFLSQLIDHVLPVLGKVVKMEDVD